MTLLKDLERKGDKKNSEYFEEYLPKIYERKEKSGLQQMVQGIQGVVVQVQHGEGITYLLELYIMTPYRIEAVFENKTHRVFVLKNTKELPRFFVLEPLDAKFRDSITHINAQFPRAAQKKQVRYLGEIYRTKNVNETQKILEEDHIRFYERGSAKNAFLANPHMAWTQISYFTNNMVGYVERDFTSADDLGFFEFGEIVELSTEDHDKLKKADEVYQKLNFHTMLKGIDHLATRVFSASREDALLEFITMTNYYFWGAYTIAEMNSSTNICRNHGVNDELSSPAKVFTANNTPFYVQSIDGIPSPTEDFVRNFGRRMHHMAYAIEDGEYTDPEGLTLKNIDYVVNQLNKMDVEFLAKIIGECTDFPDLKQIFSKSSKYSFLITEYVQRCHNFEGFFTKDNVAFLTEAAGKDEALEKTGVCD